MRCEGLYLVQSNAIAAHGVASPFVSTTAFQRGADEGLTDHPSPYVERSVRTIRHLKPATLVALPIIAVARGSSLGGQLVAT
jgi:hypothetical protein